MRELLLRILVILACPCWLAAGEALLRLEPAAPQLTGADARQQLLVTAPRDGRQRDVTAEAKFRSSDPKVAIVRSDGVILPVSDGVARITATVENLETFVEVTIAQSHTSLPLHFTNDIIPLLTKAGCNSGGCHGKQSGQNGFKLSVFGNDALADYEALIHEGRGRRLFPAVPAQSLLLAKATNRVPHGGGRRLEEDSIEYRRLLRWVVSGVPKGADDAVQVVRIEVHPNQRVMTERSQQQLLVTAHYSDGTRRDVTHETLYSSNDETLAQVDPRGRIATTMLAGEAAIVARYREQVASSRVTVPLNKDLAIPAELAKWNRSHFIDRLVADKWEQLHLFPSAEADDATFHRRVFLDLIGKLPTPAEVTSFLTDTRSDKRAQLVDRLLSRPEYADYWALKWADLLRINREDLGAKPAYQYHQWLRNALQQNQPYDQLLRELLTAQGNNERNGAVNFYTAFPTPNDLSIAVSQVFLGVRLECARCHHHPYEKWGQDDFYGLAAFFPKIQKKKGDGTELIFFVGDKGDVKHPKTQAVVLPQVLLGEPKESTPQSDPRQILADWITAPQNPFVARTLVNRVWAQLMGRGLVEPIDDMRETNPSTNEPLLRALAQDFVEHHYDMRQLIRTIVTSRVYGLSSQPNVSNARDTQNYSRAYRKRLGAEVLLDAVSDVTGEAHSFTGMPPGTRAVQLWDHRLPSSFLDTFGRPQRKTVCQCERVSETSLGQVLHLMNAPVVSDKISSPTGRAASLAASERSIDGIIVELYLATMGRAPKDVELSAARNAFNTAGATRRSAAEDVLWALLNSAEFVLNH
ncbi:MAG: Protein of unknown function (DUF1553)/Protein of unknown function [Planctomycetaceae bacterium]|nr:Protein of unknown function (DUF1553)/Protein of unknown function [Planctomycetaceae bacterium]